MLKYRVDLRSALTSYKIGQRTWCMGRNHLLQGLIPCAPLICCSPCQLGVLLSFKSHNMMWRFWFDPIRDNQIEAWGALLALFFAMSQIMRTCMEYERINKSPFASFHQHALSIPDTLPLSLPEKFVPGEHEANPAFTVRGLMNSDEATRQL